jgi:hypothetical protein
MDPKGKGIVINDKEKESFVNEPKDDKPTDSGSGHKRKDGKKKKTRRIKEIVYYDDSDKSTSSQKDNDDNDYDKRKTVNSNFSFDYSRIPHSSNAHLLSTGGAPDCPVHQATKGKNCLPGMLSTAPSCLGAIKGTPRRMEEDNKHSPSIP